MLGNWRTFREFLHVDDLGDAVVFALENWDPNAEDAPLDNYQRPLNWLNVGTGNDISIKDLADKISKYVNFKGDILWDNEKPDGTPKKQLNINKIKSIGWEPKITLDEGIIRTIKDFEIEYI